MTCATGITRIATAVAVLLVSGWASAQSSAPRFLTNEDATVRDTQTGLIWASEDNGNDVDWPGALQYCQTRGPGWRLPNVNELLQMYDTNAADTQECVGLLTCRITPMIKVSGLTLWSSEQESSAEAWYVYFNDGQQYAYSVSSTQGKRALCVK